VRLPNFRSSLSRLAVLLTAGYLLFLFGRSAYKNYQINQRIKELQASITTLNEQNTNLKNLIAYYQTETFRELEARRKLGLKKPGEIVVALPENTEEVLQTENPEEKKEQTTPNWKKWWEYLFGA
jgi:cell division protein FtsB